MKVVILTSLCTRNAGGLFFTITSLSKSLLEIGVDVSVVGFADKNFQEDKEVYGNVPIFLYKTIGPNILKKTGFSIDIHQILLKLNPDIIHIQGLWMYHSFAALRYKIKHKNCKVIIEPHGMLDPWAVKNSALKKKIAGYLFEYKNLKKCDCIHALCKSELKSIRQFGLKNDIAIIPNGVDLRTQFISNKKNKIKTLLYLGRVHPKKGIKELINGLAIIKNIDSDIFNEWNLRIAGWDQENHTKELTDIINANGLENVVKLVGPVFGKAKEEELEMADAFILPSFSEGLPMSILEAWSYKLPVVMTQYCNLPEGFEYSAAFEIEPNANNISHRLLSFFKKDDIYLKSMGENGYNLVKTKFVWKEIALSTKELYKYLLTGKNKPKFLYNYERNID